MSHNVYCATYKVERITMLKTNINSKSRQGFTIIEVVLVLAIAGLIFLMVFLALPALQRSQKNTQRKNDISRLTAALSEYQSNNRNAVPGDMNDLLSYLGGANGFSGPNNAYAFKKGGTCPTNGSTCGQQTVSSGDDQIIWYVNAVCKSAASNGTDAAAAVQAASTSNTMTRKIAFVVKMDGSSATDGSLYCVNN